MMIYWTSSYGITDGQNGVLTNRTDENYIPLRYILYVAYFVWGGHNNRIFDCKNDYFHMIKCVFDMAACKKCLMEMVRKRKRSHFAYRPAVAQLP